MQFLLILSDCIVNDDEKVWYYLIWINYYLFNELRPAKQFFFTMWILS